MSDPALPPIVQPSPQSTTKGLPSSGATGYPDADGHAQAKGSGDGVSGSRPLIFAVLFGVTGALGLPLLWYSPVFTRKEKWLWSLINSLYTLGLIAIAIASLKVIFEAFSQLR